MSKLITVILPTYNCFKYVEPAIDSILGQSYANTEILIADDGSIDETLERVSKYKDKRIRIFKNDKNIGKACTVNKVYNYAVGSLITIHDADDISLCKRFEKQVNFLNNNPGVGMCGTGFRSISENGRKALDETLMKSDYNQIMENIDFTSQFHGPTMMIRKSVIDELGQLYRPFFSKTNEDTDLAYRIAQKYKATNIPEILYEYRIHDESQCRRHLDAESRNLYKLVVFLARERANNGCDSLDRGDYETIDRFMSGLLAQYDADRSLEHREAASYLMYFKLYRKAIDESIKAIVASPGKVVNWRTLSYCVRKAIFKN